MVLLLPKQLPLWSGERFSGQLYRFSITSPSQFLISHSGRRQMHLTDTENLSGIHLSHECKAYLFVSVKLPREGGAVLCAYTMIMKWQCDSDKNKKSNQKESCLIFNQKKKYIYHKVTIYSTRFSPLTQCDGVSMPSCGVLWDSRWHETSGYFGGADLGKENIWCEDTQLQDPSTVNTCVMLNRMDKWDGGWNNDIPLHPEHVSETAWE